MTEPEIATWWVLMRERYGQRWVREYGPHPLTSWRVELAKLSMGDVDRGMAALASRKDARGNPSPYPPTLDEWMALVRKPPSRPHWEAYRPWSRKALEAPKESDAQREARLAYGREQMDRIRERLNMPRRNEQQ